MVSEADRELVRVAGLRVETLEPQELALLADVLRIPNGPMDEGAVAEIVRFGGLPEGVHFARPMTALLVVWGEFRGASQICVTWAMLEPRGCRGQRMWAWWDRMFGHREDVDGLTKSMKVALMDRLKEESDGGREVIVEMLGAGH
jgi:hypothetical protein